MNTPVSFPLAKLLKEKGFDEPCKLCVEDGDERPLPFNCGNTIHRNSLHPYYSAPTIADVVMWIYEKHEIWIQVKPGGKLETWDFIVQKKDNTFAVSYFEIKQHKPFFNSPTEAYEAAIEYTLNNLI